VRKPFFRNNYIHRALSGSRQRQHTTRFRDSTDRRPPGSPLAHAHRLRRRRRRRLTTTPYPRSAGAAPPKSLVFFYGSDVGGRDEPKHTPAGPAGDGDGGDGVPGDIPGDIPGDMYIPGEDGHDDIPGDIYIPGEDGYDVFRAARVSVEPPHRPRFCHPREHQHHVCEHRERGPGRSRRLRRRPTDDKRRQGGSLTLGGIPGDTSGGFISVPLKVHLLSKVVADLSHLT
jgi:hypothetical protein